MGPRDTRVIGYACDDTHIRVKVFCMTTEKEKKKKYNFLTKRTLLKLPLWNDTKLLTQCSIWIQKSVYALLSNFFLSKFCFVWSLWNYFMELCTVTQFIVLNLSLYFIILFGVKQNLATFSIFICKRDVFLTYDFFFFMEFLKNPKIFLLLYYISNTKKRL